MGPLVGLWRYPVKSMAAETLTQAQVGWHGIAGDRRWAFIRPHLERSGFPWLTLREVADMRQFTPRFAEPAQPDRSRTPVRTPEDDWLGATLRIGEMRMRVDCRDPRCAITTMDPDTGARDPRVLREIAQHRANCAGVYGTIVTPGPIAVGDAVVIE